MGRCRVEERDKVLGEDFPLDHNSLVIRTKGAGDNPDLLQSKLGG